jgi:AraC family transcriptional regulator
LWALPEKQDSMKLYIKNMVCARCERTVGRLLAAAGLRAKHIRLGEAELEGEPSPRQLASLRQALQAEGFELLDDRASRLIAQLKATIINEIHHEPQKPEAMNFSDFLAQAVGHEYSYLSKLFSSVEGITIEKYIIAQKIERVKELLAYGELTLSEIAWQLGYSSSQHLSNQFKQATGFTPTQFKNGHQRDRQRLDEV